MVDKLVKYWYLVVIVILTLLLSYNIYNLRKVNNINKIKSQNELALTDSVRLYKDKQNNNIYEKNILVSDNNKDLKALSKDLYNELILFKDKDKKNIITINQLNISIDRLNDTLKSLKVNGGKVLNNSINTKFDFSDKYRSLSGSVDIKLNSKDSTYSYQSYLIKDKINLKLITGLKDNGKDGFEIYMKSDNPYFKVDSIEGAIIKPDYFKKYNKQKKFGIGIHIGYGISKYGFNPYIGVGLNYNLFSF